jgi:cytoskeletal protein CcmA (bactofilin family)
MFQNNDRDGLPQSTTIGKQVTINGTFASDGNVVFDGSMEKGNVRISGTLVVGTTANIKGTVEVGKLTVNGIIEGNVVVQEDLEIGATGKIKGDIIVHGKLIITKGGIFNGKCDMGSKNTEHEKTKKDGSEEVNDE